MWILLLVVIGTILINMALVVFKGWFHARVADAYLYRFKYRLFVINHLRSIQLLSVSAVFIFAVIFIISASGNEEKVEDIGDSAKAEETKDGNEIVSDEDIHTYKIILADVTWYDAYQRCLEEGGYLLSINSDEEYNYLVEELESRGLERCFFYIGACRVENEIEYYWIDGVGESINDIPYWMASEPSYEDASMGVVEQYVDFFYYQKEGKWVINDIPNDIISIVPSYQGRVGYICEIE